MNILLTGATGYIGQPLLSLLESERHTIWTLPRLPRSSLNGIEMGRVENSNTFAQLPSLDAVIHLAAENDLYFCEEDPMKSYDVNFVGTVNALRFALSVGARLIFTSTDTVLGTSGMGVPASVYDRDKEYAERTIRRYCGNGLDLPYTILRLSTVYGEGGESQQANRGVVNFWCRTALNGDAVPVYKEVADCHRDFVHIDDVLRAIAVSLTVKSGTYHVCTGKGVSLLRMAKIIARQAGVGVEMKPAGRELHPIEYRDWIPSPDLPGWSPAIDVDSGVEETLDTYRE